MVNPNQAATYPSPYANVHKSDLANMGATIGHTPSDTWKPPTMEQWEEDLRKLDEFRSFLSSTLSEKKKHEKELAFMAESGIRQLLYPQIGAFADQQRPEPLHNENNAWQHLLNVIYKEALKRGLEEEFLEVLGS